MAAMKKVSRVRKNMDMDATKLAAAQRVLGASTETETIDRALDFVLFQHEVIDAIDRLTAAGGVVDVYGRAKKTPARVAEPPRRR
jgi:hypothetical protein